MSVDNIALELLKLPKSDRLAIVKKLLDSLLLPDVGFGSEVEYTLDERKEAVQNGSAKLVPAKEVEEKIRKKYGL